MYDALGSIPSTLKLGVDGHTCNFGTREVEARGFEVQRHPQLRGELQVILSYTNPGFLFVLFHCIFFF